MRTTTLNTIIRNIEVIIHNHYFDMHHDTMRHLVEARQTAQDAIVDLGTEGWDVFVEDCVEVMDEVDDALQVAEELHDDQVIEEIETIINIENDTVFEW